MSKNKTTIVAEPGQHSVIITREFDAARELVFKAYTDANLYKQWVGPHGHTMEIDIFEPKNGGSWRYVAKDEKGNTYGFHGVNHLVKTPELIVGTFEFEGLPEEGHVALETARFESLPDNRTRVVGISVFQSVADRDGMIASGMEHGVNEGHERLDELFEQGLIK
ncbi:MAG: SRPBCC family protein [bacterium]|nr:SRPBCC family protein [bacterium]